MMFALLVLSVSLAIFWICQFFAVFRVKRGISIGRPPGLPLIGNVLALIPTAQVLGVFSRYTKQYGKIVELYIFSKRHLLISDLDVTKEMLHKRPKLFRRIRSLDYSADKLGYKSGLLHVNGKEWNRIRKITAHSLSKQHLLTKVHAIKQTAMNLVQQLVACADGKTVIEMDKVLLTYSLRVICLTAFGVNDLQPKHADYFFGTQFPLDVTATLRFFVESSMFPFPYWCWRYSPFYWIETHATQCDKRFTDICQEIIIDKRQRQHQQTRQHHQRQDQNFIENVTQRRDATTTIDSSLIDVMLRSSDNWNRVENDCSSGGDTNSAHHPHTGPLIDSPVTDAEILANVKIFFLGGSDTSSITISWALYFLSQNPALVDALRQECDSLFSADSTASVPNDVDVTQDGSINVEFSNNSEPATNNTDTNTSLFEQISPKSMPLCHAIIKETLRLCSPAAVVVSETESTTDPVVMSNGLIIYPGDEIFTYFDGILTDETVFENATQFDPYRWLPSNKTHKSTVGDKYESNAYPGDARVSNNYDENGIKEQERLLKMESVFIPFGHGPRMCPGMALAMCETVLAITAIIHHFNVSLACPLHEIERIFNFAAMPNKMPMVLTKREVEIACEAV